MFDKLTQHAFITERRRVWQLRLPDHDYIISWCTAEGQGRAPDSESKTQTFGGETVAPRDRMKVIKKALLVWIICPYITIQPTANHCALAKWNIFVVVLVVRCVGHNYFHATLWLDVTLHDMLLCSRFAFVSFMSHSKISLDPYWLSPHSVTACLQTVELFVVRSGKMIQSEFISSLQCKKKTHVPSLSWTRTNEWTLNSQNLFCKKTPWSHLGRSMTEEDPAHSTG